MEAQGMAEMEGAVTQRGVSGGVEEAKGAVKATAGNATKNRRLQAKGEIKRASGRTKRK
jgi:uncharacterized protein YjbJ (UPF0337 family)